MSKIVLIPENKEQFKLDCDGLLIGIDNLSINYKTFELEDLKEIKDKEIFVILNKNIHNQDLDLLKETLVKLNDYHIKGVLFYDAAIINLKEKLNLNYDLIWAQEHHTTNYLTADFYFENGVRGMMLSNDITVSEMAKIADTTKMYTMVQLFGYLPIFTSRRPLITNYLKTYQLPEHESYQINKEGKTYPIYQNNHGTVIYSPFILNGLEESLVLNKKVDYIILNSYMVSYIADIIPLFKNINEDNKDEMISKIATFGNFGKGFLNQETIYRVKK